MVAFFLEVMIRKCLSGTNTQNRILAKNVELFLQNSKELVDYIPQKNFLKLLNYGDGIALAEFHGYVYESFLMWNLKDYIDRGFMSSFNFCLVSKEINIFK